METIITVLGITVMSLAAFILGKKLEARKNENETNLLSEKLKNLTEQNNEQDSIIRQQTEDIKNLTAQRDVQKANVENANKLMELQQKQHEDTIAKMMEESQKQKDSQEKQTAEMKETFLQQMADLKTAYDKQLEQAIANAKQQLDTLKEMNRKQVEDQMVLIREQMRTTSETVLKARQDELGERNREQVSKIIDPLQKSLQDMQAALNMTKEQQKEALTRLDETIKQNMKQSESLGQTADRLTRALTGEVKVQGNFGELKLRQLLEDLELKEGEQFDTQATLRDHAGRSAKGDDGKGLIPDFILHFPNNRHVVVDSKMSLTDYERYMNAEDGTPEKSEYLKAHIASVRAQVKRLAKKEYTKFLPEGYNRLNFAIMYVPIEGALNLALLNDTTLWREAYDEGVLILGPQTMYMNLRVLEMMWTQVKQLKNQQAMMDAANIVIDRVQDFSLRFSDVETSMNDTIKKITKLKITTAEGGPSIITAARKLIQAGAKENKKKKSLTDANDLIFLEGEEDGNTEE